MAIKDTKPPEQIAAYDKVDRKFDILWRSTLDKIAEIIEDADDLTPQDAERLISVWFGEDGYDSYLEYMTPEEGPEAEA